MARKIEHIYHLFAFAELTCLDEFQVRSDCYFRNVDSLVKHLSSMLCKVKGKRELIKNISFSRLKPGSMPEARKGFRDSPADQTQHHSGATLDENT